MTVDTTSLMADAAKNDETDDVVAADRRQEPAVRVTSPDGDGRAGRIRRRDAHKATRWLHTYVSMISLTLILFFGATGITLNHPEWTFGLSGSQSSVAGAFPPATQADGNVDFLAVSQFVQDSHGVRGEVVDYSADSNQGVMSFRGPGYAADLTFEVATGSYVLSVDEQGLVAALNDLHKGRNTGGSWGWLIDVAGGLLVVVALSGLALQFFLSRRRTRAYVVAAGGALASAALMVVTLN
ncbi:MAG: PepSY-associated TM helix domain-containing protein [Acidimicrobiales bacterium]|nr:PepSY-associated TM helix domain-containing protein [Acidimicrobiales bacterium]